MRLHSIDALRGLAAVLMVQQHLGVWMVNIYRYPPEVRSLFAAINMTGGAAAPLFVTLAGVGVTLAAVGSSWSGSRTFARGITLALFGEALNFLVPDWFSPTSFYVLHLLALVLMLAPVMVRMPSWLLFVTAGLVLGGAVVGQSWLETPMLLSGERLHDGTLPGGFLRLALLEGQFPLLPWLALALLGVWAGRQIREERLDMLGSAALWLGSMAALLRSLTLVIPDATSELPWRAVCRTSFFPLSSVYALMLAAISLALLWCFMMAQRRGWIGPGNWLIPLGRSSLSLVVVHIFVFRQGLATWDLLNEWTPLETVGTIFAFLLLWQWLAKRWSAWNYRFGLEWCLRVPETWWHRGSRPDDRNTLST